MKKIHLLFVACLCYFGSTAQVEIREFSNGQEVGNDISGTTVSISVNGNGSLSRVFSIKNTSGSVVNLRISRLRLNTPPTGWIDGLSWAPNPDPNFEGMCFAGAQMSTNPWLTPNTFSVDDQNRANLSVDFYVDGPGCGHYRYYVMPDQSTTPIDSIDIEVCYNAGITEGNELKEMTVYPNPASHEITVTAPAVEGSVTLHITDLHGKVVYRGEMNAIKNLDVNEFGNGVYLIELIKNNEILQTRKMVVSH